EQAAAQDFPRAQNILGDLYWNGDSVPQDKSQAVHWYEQAARQDYPSALCNLGLCYENGDGVEQDVAKAVEYY
ncbi:MAG TPA: hypothetical protein DIT49_06320, partial [Clostridiales bacterium]|nr:hypothetical protein [Clostridiales bacterium]